ncbi:MAG: DNA cytosine methyltransferase [Oscillospiraceae bacterium]|nr:DNA cytosine methyltransferase [Oscillospiraceae bacterium]
MSKRFTAIDLFAGIGGFRSAIDKCGGRTIAYSEINNDAINTYELNYPDSIGTNLGDITLLKTLPPNDLITAGVPCQSWSIAGKNLGFDDDRGQLWNDALYLLNQSKPKAFIFENVKGLADPRNKDSLRFIMERIREAGYNAAHYLLNSYNYGVPQSRVRIYIIGFFDKRYGDAFKIPDGANEKIRLADIIEDEIVEMPQPYDLESTTNLFGDISTPTSKYTSLSKNNNGHNDYFLFNDLRNGSTTIHSWDIMETTERQKHICLILLKNRRKKEFGPLDGNPLSIEHFQFFDKKITVEEIEDLTNMGILKKENYAYEIVQDCSSNITPEETIVLGKHEKGIIIPDILLMDRDIRSARIKLSETIESLEQKGIISCSETRYDFKQRKISTGLYGVSRIFLPSSSIFPTLVASDTNDYVTNVSITATGEEEYKRSFLEKVYLKGNYRKITKIEACRIQGFPDDFHLPESRSKWMKLIGNSVSIPVIEKLVSAIIDTGVFD